MKPILAYSKGIIYIIPGESDILKTSISLFHILLDLRLVQLSEQNPE